MKLSRFIFYLPILFYICGCGNPATTFKAKLVTEEGIEVSLNDILLEFIFVDESSNNKSYQVSPKKDGSISFTAQVRGEQFWQVNVASYPEGTFVYPFITPDGMNDVIVSNKNICLGQLYLFDAIQLQMPTNNENIVFPSDIIFSWAPVNGADFYDLFIKKVQGKLGSRVVSSTHLIETNFISYGEIEKLPVYTGYLSFDEINTMSLYNRKRAALDDGYYQFKIIAYKKDEKKKSFISLTHSPDFAGYFTIGNSR